MQKYAKLKEGVLIYAPINKGNILNYNLNTEAIQNDGFKPVVFTNKPVGYFKEVFEETETEIIQSWEDVTEEVFLQKKSEKLFENTQKAKSAIENGYVIYKNAQFETNAQTVGDLTATMLMLKTAPSPLEGAASEQSAEGGAEEASTAGTFIASDVKTEGRGEGLNYLWLSRDDKLVELLLEDFVALGNLIAEYKNNVWNTKYMAFKEQIESAENIEDLNDINIEYEVEMIDLTSSKTNEIKKISYEDAIKSGLITEEIEEIEEKENDLNLTEGN